MKRKWIIILLMVLLTVAIATALDDCKRVMDSSDIPCLQRSSWIYPNPCNTYSVEIFNSNATLLDTRTMGDYGTPNFCNITFNYTSQDTYFLNFTSRDSAIIIVEADEMNYITIGIILAVITFMFAYMATKVKHWTLQIAFSLFTMVMVVFDFFISARIIEIVDSAQTGMIHYLDTFFFIGVTLFRFALAGTVIFIIYYMYKHILRNPLRKREKREEEGFYG